MDVNRVAQIQIAAINVMNDFSLNIALLLTFHLIVTLLKNLKIEVYIFRFLISLLLVRSTIISACIEYGYNYNMMRYVWFIYMILGILLVIYFSVKEFLVKCKSDSIQLNQP